MGCLAFDEPRHAMQYLLGRSPRVIGIGEAHALSGDEQGPSTAELFWRELLPELEGRASHLLVELLQPKAECAPDTRAAESVAREVAKGQSSRGQSDYVTLGQRAKSLGITPFLLSPTCTEYARVREAPPEDRLVTMLEVIAQVTARMARRALAGLERARSERLVLAYGGALHNDLSPDEIRRAWSYGPDLQAATGGRYLELDLIRREQVGAGPAWRRQPWYQAFVSGSLPAEKAVLLSPSDATYVLFFPTRRQ